MRGVQDAVGATPMRLARLVGRALAVAVAAISALRRTKPLHPRGTVSRGTLTMRGARRAWGAPLLDGAGTHACLVRVSRAVGFPRGWPDIGGVAVRVPDGERDADLLFATTGTGVLARYVLLVRREPRTPLTTLLPVRSSRGPVQLRLDAVGPRSWVLSAALARSARWEPLGRLELAHDASEGHRGAREGHGDEARGDDEPVRFDPVGNVPRGLEQCPLVRAVREPGYARAQREPVRA